VSGENNKILPIPETMQGISTSGKSKEERRKKTTTIINNGSKGANINLVAVHEWGQKEHCQDLLSMPGEIP
jgi:hypothetical protein